MWRQILVRYEDGLLGIEIFLVVARIVDPVVAMWHAFQPNGEHVEPIVRQPQAQKVVVGPILKELKASLRFILSKRQVISMFSPNSVPPTTNATGIISIANRPSQSQVFHHSPLHVKCGLLYSRNHRAGQTTVAAWAAAWITLDRRAITFP
jgi:hypothetical protein